jgi:hypothetical protein
MMPAAPDLFPPLDDALRALDGFPGRPADVATARAFLERLDDVRDVPPVVLDKAQAEHMEGVFLAGVRCADESGHVLVMSLPVFLELCPPPVPARADQVLDWFTARPLAAVALVLWGLATLAALADHDAVAAGWFLVAGAVAAAWSVLAQLPPTRCTYDCNSGRACTCRPQPNMKGPK